MSSIRVVSYNASMLPGIMGDGDEDLERVTEITKILSDENGGYDILCLQEIFDEDARDLLCSTLKATHP